MRKASASLVQAERCAGARDRHRGRVGAEAGDRASRRCRGCRCRSSSRSRRSRRRCRTGRWRRSGSRWPAGARAGRRLVFGCRGAAGAGRGRRGRRGRVVGGVLRIAVAERLRQDFVEQRLGDRDRLLANQRVGAAANGAVVDDEDAGERHADDDDRQDQLDQAEAAARRAARRPCCELSSSCGDERWPGPSGPGRSRARSSPAPGGRRRRSSACSASGGRAPQGSAEGIEDQARAGGDDGAAGQRIGRVGEGSGCWPDGQRRCPRCTAGRCRARLRSLPSTVDPATSMQTLRRSGDRRLLGVAQVAGEEVAAAAGGELALVEQARQRDRREHAERSP